MQEPGTGEGVPKVSIENQVQAAKKSWQEGNSTPARETVRFISDELSHQIEYGESSKDPLVLHPHNFAN